MANLGVNYMGLNLESPIILGSSTLAKSVEGIKQAQEAGVGAVVLKSLFEEELRNDKQGNLGDIFHPEAYEYMMNEAAMVYGSAEYIEHIRNAKAEADIPIIASINCEGEDWWSDYAADLEFAGADAIELNISYVPFDLETTSAEAEQKYIDVLKAVKEKVKFPVAVKIGRFITAIPNFVAKLKNAGADSVTMFNRYYQTSIDLENMSLKPVHFYSTENETYGVLRWVAIINKLMDYDICASSGIRSGNTALQHLLAGAKTVQVVSEFYKSGFGAVKKMHEEISEWMDKNGYSSLDQIRGLALKQSADEMRSFERVQYMKIADGKLLGE